MKSRIISVSGKGGTGKTTLVALLLKVLLESNKYDSILVVDADPATNLPDVLGIEVEKTVGMVANELKKKIEKGLIPIGVSKSDLLEAWVYSTLVELQDFDLLAMGRTEGEGCYCYVNSVLTRILDTISTNYQVVLMDMEAGLEHISRRTDRDVDTMIIVTDPSLMGLKTAKRIRDLLREVHVDVREVYLVGNCCSEETEKLVRDWATRIGVKYAGALPYDANVAEFNLKGIPLLKLPSNSPSVIATRRIANTIGLI